jgi:hypothetical protein
MTYFFCFLFVVFCQAKVYYVDDDLTSNVELLDEDNISEITEGHWAIMFHV